MFDNSAAVPLELLRFPRPFSQSPTFERALRRRIDELATFSHTAAGTIRSIQWLGIGDGLALVSNQVTGRRLSDAFGQARGPAYAMELLRQLTAFVAALEQHGRDVSHGAINADRVIITETGRLVVIEHVLGSALATPSVGHRSRTRAALGRCRLPGGRHSPCSTGGPTSTSSATWPFSVGARPPSQPDRRPTAGRRPDLPGRGLSTRVDSPTDLGSAGSLARTGAQDRWNRFCDGDGGARRLSQPPRRTAGVEAGAAHRAAPEPRVGAANRDGLPWRQAAVRRVRNGDEGCLRPRGIARGCRIDRFGP